MKVPPQNILITDSTDIYGGGEFYVLELARELQRRGHHVLVACKPSNLLYQKCSDAGVPVAAVDFPASGRLLRFIGELKDLIRLHKITLLHSNSNYDRTAGAIAAALCGVRHVTNVHSFHSIQFNLTHWMRNRFATDRIIVDGYCVRDLLAAEDGIPPAKVSVLHLGVNPDVMKKDDAARRRIRLEFGIRDDEIVVGNVARMVPMKGQEFLIEAFARVVRHNGRARLLIVGDGEQRRTLETLARSSGAEARVIFAGFRDDLIALYSAFDIYAHSSVEGGGETFPFAVLQALAQELPAVVTRVGDVAEMIAEGENGYVVPDRDAGALAGPIQALCEDAELRRRMAANSRERLLRLFTTGRMVDDVEGIYGAALGLAGNAEG